MRTFAQKGDQRRATTPPLQITLGMVMATMVQFRCVFEKIAQEFCCYIFPHMLIYTYLVQKLLMVLLFINAKKIISFIHSMFIQYFVTISIYNSERLTNEQFYKDLFIVFLLFMCHNISFVSVGIQGDIRRWGGQSGRAPPQKALGTS